MSKKKILVVDDTEWNRDLVVQLLEDDYTVLQAIDGEEAVRKTQEDKPDLILMDLGMPVMDGWEANQGQRCFEAYPDYRRHVSRHGRRRDRRAQGRLRRLSPEADR